MLHRNFLVEGRGSTELPSGVTDKEKHKVAIMKPLIRDKIRLPFGSHRYRRIKGVHLGVMGK